MQLQIFICAAYPNKLEVGHTDVKHSTIFFTYSLSFTYIKYIFVKNSLSGEVDKNGDTPYK